MIVVQIVCNDCGEVGEHTANPKQRPPHSLRKWLQDKMGWKVNIMLEGRAGHDFCHRCIEKEI